jgi:hypothetical protein
MVELFALVISGKNLFDAKVDEVLRRIGQRFERLGIDQVAERIPEKTSAQIEFSERSTPGIPRTTRLGTDQNLR